MRAVPEGTFALNGTVRPNGAVFRARVEVSGGVGPPASTETSDLGTYRLLGVGGRVRVTVRMDGFASRSAELDVSADTQHEVVLALDGSARPWRLSVTPATTCTHDPSLGQQTYSTDVFVEVLGTAHATWNGSEYAGRLEGYIGAIPFVGPGYCYAADHQVTLAPG